MSRRRTNPDPATIAAAMAAADADNQVAPKATAGPGTLRRWESSDTHRLNSDHWRDVGASSDINVDLAGELPTLRRRCQYEQSNNPFLAGMIETHTVDLIGRDGPRLQVVSDDDNYNSRLEAIWKEVYQDLDAFGDAGGADILTTCVGLWWTAGEHLLQVTTNNSADTLVKLRALLIDPDLLNTPMGEVGADNITLGIQRDRNGRRSVYHIDQVERRGDSAYRTGQSRPLPASAIRHQFRRVVPGQERGIPWMAPSLDAAADLRDFDAEVMTAARNAAANSVLLSTTHPDAPYLAINASIDIERGTVGTVPPGWEPTNVTANHPVPRYVEYRAERQRDLGRPAQMPLMLIRLGSEDHSYSSARFDAQVYLRALLHLHGWTERQTLNPLLDMVAREARLARELRTRPQFVTYEWTWPRPPHVDPKKEAEAETIFLQNGTLDLATAATNHGTDLETLIARRTRVSELLRAAELPPAVGETAPPVYTNQPAMADA